MISFQDFKKMEIRVAVIKDARAHPDADRLYVLKLDTGGEEIQVVAGIRDFYKNDELVGKKVIAITNLEAAKIRGVESAGMVLAAKDDESLSLLVPEKDVKVGSAVS
jgi:methionyl-tRNA synthetase